VYLLLSLYYRTRRPELSKIVNKFNNLNINNMENGLNLEKPLEAAKAGKRVARAGWNRQECSHT
jgi:hypothetical protein